ncbi:MAG: response regulator transcription factor [Clostridia bacterium]|nr:response regulator transcription factor [Clostridia bacterium]MBN2882501.1 response regulator transcription factor [Clostridia bacterium]
MIKVLIADDNETMSEILKEVIDGHKSFETVAIGADGESALALFEKHTPEVVFMDIEMPGMSGVDCARHILEGFPDTYIVFSTAHDEYMSEAFEMYAFDYILKPFSLDRVRKTLDRLAEMLDKEKPSGSSSAIKLDKIMIKNRDGMSFVDIDEIMLVFREGSRTKIVTKRNSYFTGMNLNELEAKLEGDAFMRTHKSYIVNLKYIEQILPYGRWTHVVKLKGLREDALITHEKLQTLEELL